MKYKLWWIASTLIATVFGANLLCGLAFGVTYLYWPKDDELKGASLFGQFVATLVFGGISCFAYNDGNHTK